MITTSSAVRPIDVLSMGKIELSALEKELHYKLKETGKTGQRSFEIDQARETLRLVRSFRALAN